jgi:hypothetical protein
MVMRTLVNSNDSSKTSSSLLKYISLFCVGIFFFTFLAISFHYHNDLAAHPACPLCKLISAFASGKKPTVPVLVFQKHSALPSSDESRPVRASETIPQRLEFFQVPDRSPPAISFPLNA